MHARARAPPVCINLPAESCSKHIFPLFFTFSEDNKDLLCSCVNQSLFVNLCAINKSERLISGALACAFKRELVRRKLFAPHELRKRNCKNNENLVISGGASKENLATWTCFQEHAKYTSTFSHESKRSNLLN